MYGNVGCAWADLGPQGRWDLCPRLRSPELPNPHPLKPWTGAFGLEGLYTKGEQTYPPSNRYD